MKSALHRGVWQRLPYRLRRSVLFGTSALLAARPKANLRPSLPIYVVGTFGAASGLGQSARFCHRALSECGWSPRSVDITGALMQPEDFDGVQSLETVIPPGPGTLILHVNAPLVPLAMLHLGRSAIRDKYIVGSWAWELPQAPPDWRTGVGFVHEIWMPASFGKDAVDPIASDRPVRVIPYAVSASTAASVPLGSTPKVFTVLLIFSMASSFARKNPLAAIAAFRQAFGNDPGARLLIKTSRTDAFPGGVDLLRTAIGEATNIEVDERVLPAVAIDRLYAEADVVMSLHRSEGFGLAVAEAMIHGVPAVATNWSATTDFLDETCGVPIPYSLVPARDPQGTYDHPDMQWAEPDIGAAAVALKELRQDPDLRARLGAAGRRRAKDLWSADAYARAVSQHLGLPLPPR